MNVVCLVKYTHWRMKEACVSERECWRMSCTRGKREGRRAAKEVSLGRQGRKDSRNKMASKEEGIAKQTKEKNKKKRAPIRSWLCVLSFCLLALKRVLGSELSLGSGRPCVRRGGKEGREGKAGRRTREGEGGEERKTKHKIKDRDKEQEATTSSFV